MYHLFVNTNNKIMQHDYQLLKQQLEAVDLENPIGIEKTTIHLIIDDLWELLDHGNSYKAFICEDSIRMKTWRLFVVEFFASLKQFKKNENFFHNANRRNFYFAIILAKKFITTYSEKLFVQPNVAQIRTHYFNFKDQDDEGIQQKLINEAKMMWFKEMFYYNNLFNATIQNLIEQFEAIETLLGNDVWTYITEKNIELLLSNLENNHFSEVLFWKSKVAKEKFLKQNHEEENTTYVFCVQQDETMIPFSNFQLGLGLNVSDFSAERHYDFIYLPFAQQVEQETIMLQGKITASNYFDLIRSLEAKSVGGPINFKEAINFAFTMLKLELSQSRSGKIVLLCNELIVQNLPSEEIWLQAVKNFKREMNVEIIVLYIGERETLKPIWFADQIITGGEFTVLY